MEPTTARPRPPLKWSKKRPILGVISVVGGLIAWQIIAVNEWINPLFFPKLTVVADRMEELARSGDLQNHIWATLSTFLLGLTLAVLFGMIVGIALASSRVLDAML
jgi:ABC-type nitrate/sulfonate/bicarbonate transport system permease component